MNKINVIKNNLKKIFSGAALLCLLTLSSQIDAGKTGKLPPMAFSGACGYEYEQGKISRLVPDDHEIIFLNIISSLWYNSETECFDNSLFSEEVLRNGQGFRRLREALKYVYLAGQKGIKSYEYTCEYNGRKFTSLAKLKSLGKISKEEVEHLDISDVPVEYITRPQVRQEFFNIVSGVPGAIYCSQSVSQERGHELKADAKNILAIFNYFYGTQAETVAELGESISTRERKIRFEEGDDIRMIVKNFMTNIVFNIIIDISGCHMGLLISNEEVYLLEDRRERGTFLNDTVCVAKENQDDERLDDVIEEDQVCTIQLFNKKLYLNKSFLLL